MKTYLIIYVIISLAMWVYAIWVLWQDDRNMDARGSSGDKFGYNFRKAGSRTGKFAITETALWCTTPFLPIVNIATLLFLIYLKTDDLRTRQ